MQWKHDPSESNVNNLNNVSWYASKNYKKKKMKAYLKAKFVELETNSKIKSIRDLYSSISDIKKG
jgi:hypothetical protein